MPAESKGPRRKDTPAHPPTLILGVGNILLRDEGVGVHVVETLKRVKLPEDVELLDGGTATMAFLDSLGNREKVIVIDAVRGNEKPGTLYRFTPAEISVHKEMITSVHQIGLLDALAMVAILGDAPQNVTIYGIEPKELGSGLDLSPEVAAVVPRVVELVLGEVGILASSGC